MATSTPSTNNHNTPSEASPSEAEGSETTAKPPLLKSSSPNPNSAEITDSVSQLRLGPQRPPHIRTASSTSIPIPARDDRSIHHRPTSGTGAEVYAGSSDTDSTAPNSPRAADSETRAAIRAAKEEKPVGVGAGAGTRGVPKVNGQLSALPAAIAPPTSGHAITAAKLFGHRYFAGEGSAGDSSAPGSEHGGGGPGSTVATPGGTEPAYTPPEMSRQNSGGLHGEKALAVPGAVAAAVGGTPLQTAGLAQGQNPVAAPAAAVPAAGEPVAAKSGRRGTVGKEAAPKTEKATSEKKSMFGKLFDKKDGVNGSSDSEGATASSGMGKMLGRKPSAKKSVNGDAGSSSNGGAEMARQASNGAASVGGSDKKPALGRAPTDKTDGERSSKFREMVGMAPKLGRKASSSKGGRSDDGRSDDGGDNKSRSGSQATASLLKKYGVCEKAAIGKGATAVVRLAHKWDRGTDKLYAVKEFRKRRKGESEKEYVKKLTSEFCISSTLHHENVVETVDLVQDENHHWCEVMEYCPGGDLYAAIKRGDMSQAEINSYFKQILLGVTYLHSMGVAHRDIKPENLLLDSVGRIKITDFGVSDVFRMCWEKTTHLSKGLCGSEPYLPKEMFERKEYDARLVDVWACAVVFYCCCMQELPWRVAKPNDPSFASFLGSYGHASTAPLTNLQRESRAVIKKMLQPEPEKRLQMEDVMADSWVKGLEVIEVAVPTMTMRERI